MKDQIDFENILKKLKKEFKGGKNIPVDQQQAQAGTRELVVNWFAQIFKKDEYGLIDNNKDIFVDLIDNINFDHD